MAHMSAAQSGRCPSGRSGKWPRQSSRMESSRHRLRPPLSLLTFIFLLQLLIAASSSSPDDSDLHALLSLKSFITEDPKGALSSWTPAAALTNTTGTPNGTRGGFCAWPGVTCGGGRVTALRLRGLGLAGALSPRIGNLTGLRLLDLSDNKLRGEVPPALAACSALRLLNLSTNFLSGAIPASLGRLSRLAVFNVERNGISGPIPPSLANLTALARFGIVDNSVRGEIPPWLGNLTSLVYLNVEENRMSGRVPPSLSKLPRLRLLGIAVNMLEGTIPSGLFNMSSLEVLDVGDNNLSGSVLPSDMGCTLPSLTQLGAYNNGFEGPIPSSLSNMSRLELLVVDGNRLRGRVPPSIGSNGVLKVFDVNYNELQATEPADWDFLTTLANCSGLRAIAIRQNNFSGTLPSTIANLSLELEQMFIAGNQITGNIPTGLGRYRKLTTLELADNLFTGDIPSDIGMLSSLHEVSLEKNALRGEIPVSLGNITRLNLFDLSSNYLEGRIPETLGNFTMLTSIDISNNLLTGRIPQEVLSIPSLSILCDLSDNALNGSIPLQVGRLVNLVKIDLSSNELSGGIPNALGGCIELQFIHLQGNLLQGQIPEDLTALKGLEVLDLSNNKLSGPIPGFLGSFKLLRSLNLSFNQLSGPVPNVGIFSNASATSLEGNGALCGGPSFFHFPSCPYQQVQGRHGHDGLLHTLIFILVGAFAFVVICIATCYYYIKILRSKPVGSNQDQGHTFATLMYQRISYAELSMVTDSFSAENLIGRGSFSSVYKGVLSSCGRDSINVAVKVLDLRQRGASRSFMLECNALKRIKHRKLVKVITVCDSLDHNGDEFKALVLEFIPNKSLDTWLHPSGDDGSSMSSRRRRLSFEQRLSIALDVAEALEYLHHRISPSIAHCDVKPSNILLDEDMTAHLGDFGLAKIMNVGASGESLGGSSSVIGIKGTIGYIAPEGGMGTLISIEGDVFSYGVLLLEILTGRRPTDSSFHGDETSLPKFVEMACPDKLLEVMDPSLLQDVEEQQEIVDVCIGPISRLGLACCRDSPRQRMKMGEVVKELSAIKMRWEQPIRWRSNSVVLHS